MKRLHVGATVTDLQASIEFYKTLFGAEPTVVRDDYAKWQLEDPRVNFSLSQRGDVGGVDHLGIQVETDEELAESQERLAAAGVSLLDTGEITCCYHKSKKHWVIDPDGVPWETFATRGEAVVYGQDSLEPGALPKAKRQAQDSSRHKTEKSCC